MNIVSLQTFNAYMNDYETSTDIDFLKNQALSSAQSIVEAYLGYSFSSSLQTDFFTIVPSQKEYYLHAIPVADIESVYIDGKCVCSFEYMTSKETIRFKKIDKELIGKELRVNYYTSKNTSPLIPQTILRIATLLYMEQSQNIGVTSKSFADGSRTFINYTNFSKYLQPLDNLKTKVF